MTWARVCITWRSMLQSKQHARVNMGKDLSTIAQEIRSLAVGSSEIARNIGTYIRTIQNETNAASQSVEQNTQQVVMQSELVTQTGVALEVIGEVTDQLSRLIEDVCSTAENQTQGSQLVVSSVDEISPYDR